MDDLHAADQSGTLGDEPVPHASMSSPDSSHNQANGRSEVQGSAGLEDDELADVLEGQLAQATSSIPIITSAMLRPVSPTSDDLFAALMGDIDGEAGAADARAAAAESPATESVSFAPTAHHEESEAFDMPLDEVAVDDDPTTDFEPVWIEPAFYDESVSGGIESTREPAPYGEPAALIEPPTFAPSEPVPSHIFAMPVASRFAPAPERAPEPEPAPAPAQEPEPEAPAIPELVEPPATPAQPSGPPHPGFFLTGAPPPMPGSNVIPAGDFALPDPPHHRSLADHELVSVVQSSQGTSGALAELEMQLQLRIEEARDFEEWERAMLAIGSPGAYEAIQQARRVRAARLMPPQAPVAAPHPLVEPPQFASAVDESDLDDEPSGELNLAPEWLPVSAASRGFVSDSSLNPPFPQAAQPAPSAATASGAAAATAADAAAARPETQRPSIVERNDGEPTPQELRTSRAITMFWLWFAPHSSVVGVGVGASMLALGLSLRQALVAVLVGVALSMIPLGLGTLAGRSTGQPAMVASRAVFGVVGNILPAVISVATRVLWACALAVVAGGGVAAIIEQVAGFDAAWVGIVAAAAILAVGGLVAAVGYTVIVRVSVAVGVLSAVLVGALVVVTLPSLDVSRALLVPDGSWLVTLSAAVVVFSVVGLAWATSGADVARYQRAGGSGAPALAWAMAGCVIPAVIVIGYGAVLAFSVPDASAALAANPAAGLAAVVPAMFLVPLLVLLVGGLVCGVTIALYSAGFGLTAAGLTVARPIAVVVASVLALAASLALSLGSEGFGVWFRDGVTTFAVPMAAWVGIVGADFLLRRRPLDGLSLMRRGGAYPHVVPLNLVAFIGVTALGWGFTTADLSGLAWQGYLWPVVGVSAGSPAASTDVGVLVALVLGLLVALATGIPAIRRQESLRR